MCYFKNDQRGIRGVLVAMSNKEVHYYKDKHVIDVIKTEGVVTALKYGRFGREGGALVMTTKTGSLIVKLLRRMATFSDAGRIFGPPPQQSTKLDIPKKTKLFVDMTMRERENATQMHRTFQQDLARIELLTSQHYLAALKGSHTPISSSPDEPLRFSAQIKGIGPLFKLIVTLQNTSSSKPSCSVFIMFQYDDNLYAITRHLIKVPILIPGVECKFDTLVECLSDKGISDNIKVMVCREGHTRPLITGVVNMPVSEGLVIG